MQLCVLRASVVKFNRFLLRRNNNVIPNKVFDILNHTIKKNSKFFLRHHNKYVQPYFAIVRTSILFQQKTGLLKC